MNVEWRWGHSDFLVVRSEPLSAEIQNVPVFPPRLKVFNTEQMNQAVFAFRRYEDASLRYTGIESHEGLTHYGLYDTVVARE